MIAFRLLGSFEARGSDGTLIRAPGRRSVALLACLAIHESPWPRAALAALLWPDRGPEQARASLRQELARLRAAFGPVLEARADDPIMVPALDRRGIDADVLRFRSAACDVGREAEAIALYRGDLLEGLSWLEPGAFADWLDARRAEMRSAAVACMRRLLRTSEASESLARRLADLAPGCEEAHACLIRLHARAGDISRALEAYHFYAAEARRIGREPSAEIQAALMHLLAREWLPDRLLANVKAYA